MRRHEDRDRKKAVDAKRDLEQRASTKNGGCDPKSGTRKRNLGRFLLKTRPCGSNLQQYLLGRRGVSWSIYLFRARARKRT